MTWKPDFVNVEEVAGSDSSQNYINKIYGERHGLVLGA